MSTGNRNPIGGTHRAPRRKLRFEEIVRAIRAEHEAAQRMDGDALNRRVVLAKLGAAFEVEEDLLLLRGFDRAYRRVIEGL